MSKPYPPRLFRRRGDDSRTWKFENQTMWVISTKMEDWNESRFDDPEHLIAENSDIEEIDSECRVIADENDHEWDENAMMNALDLE